jgi:hypothetical protein
MGNVFVPDPQAAIIRRQMNEGYRHASGTNMMPWPIIVSGTIPPSVMGTIPVTAKEKNVHIYLRGVVNIRPRYYHHRRGRSNPVRRWRRDSYSNMDIDLGGRSIRVCQSNQKQHWKK